MPESSGSSRETPSPVETSIAQLRQAVAVRPPAPLAFLELGDLLARLGRFNEAIAVFEDGLALEPRAIILRVGLGYALLNRTDRAAARRQFLQVRAAAPERYDGMVGLANVLALDGEYAEAVELYRRALALQPDNALTRTSLGKCLLELGDREAGEEALRIAARASPDRIWPSITALAATPRGRLFLRRRDGARHLGVDAG